MIHKARVTLLVTAVCFSASNALAQGPFNTNLLTNPGAEAGDMSGWTIVDNGGDGWGATSNVNMLRTGSYCFYTSYGWDTRFQQIDLLAAGFSEAELDAAPAVRFSEWVRARPDASSEYFIRFELLDAAEQVIVSWNHGDQNSPIQLAAGSGWFEESRSFRVYGPGLRYIRFVDGGKDTVFWAGPYGAHFDDASVMLDDSIMSDGDFDALTVGSPPDCGTAAGAWNFGTTYIQAGLCESSVEQFSIAATTSFDPGAQGNSLHLLIVNEPASNYHLPNRFNVVLQQGDPVTVAFDIWVVSGGGGGSVYVGGDHGGGGYDATTDRGPQLTWNNKQEIFVTFGQQNVTVVPGYLNDAWQSVRLEIDLTADTFDFFWGPRGGPLQLVGDDLGFRSGTQDQLDRFTVMNFGGLTPDSNAYFDNVTVTLGGCSYDPCDMNCDGVINAVDIEFFIDLLFGGAVPCDVCTGDTNGDGMVNAEDIEGFINCLFP